MAAGTARGLLANGGAAALGLLISSPQLRGPGSAVGAPAPALEGRLGTGSCGGVPFWVIPPTLPAVSCGCLRCSVLAKFLSMSACASVMRKAISVQTHEVS